MSKTQITLAFILLCLLVGINFFTEIKQDQEIEDLRAKFESGEIEVKGDTSIVDVEPLTQ